MLTVINGNPNVTSRQDDIETRLMKARSILTALASNDNFSTLNNDTVAALLLCAQDLVSEAQIINSK